MVIANENIVIGWTTTSSSPKFPGSSQRKVTEIVNELIIDEEIDTTQKVNKISGAEIIEKKIVKSDSSISLNDITNSILIEDLVREYFTSCGMEKALEFFEKEKPRSKFSLNSNNQLTQALYIEKEFKKNQTQEKSSYKSILEVLIASMYQTSKTCTNLPKNSSLEKKRTKSKPQLNIDTEISIEQINDQQSSSSQQIKIGAPGHTPHPNQHHGPSLDLTNDFINTKIISTLTQPSIINLKDDSLELIQKKKINKRVTFTTDEELIHEYIFFRETPPKYVTTSIEEASQVIEKLKKDDPEYNQSLPKERFIELSSSDVGKYIIGMYVEGLGDGGNVCGKIAKKYGTKQCGQTGPGTIVIDTQPEEEPMSKPNVHEQITKENINSKENSRTRLQDIFKMDNESPVIHGKNVGSTPRLAHNQFNYNDETFMDHVLDDFS